MLGETVRDDDAVRLRQQRLPFWIALTLAFAALAYAGKYLDDRDLPDDLLYRWSTVAGAVVQYAVLGALSLAIARGIPRRSLGLRSPRSWPTAVGLSLAIIVATYIVAALYEVASRLDASDEQGLLPKEWDTSRLAPLLANAVVVCVVAPIVEEFMYRSVGYSLLGSVLGRTATLLVVGILFGVSHGLLIALPILAFFGTALAWLRERTESVFPPMLAHAVFNTIALIAALTVDRPAS